MKIQIYFLESWILEVVDARDQVPEWFASAEGPILSCRLLNFYGFLWQTDFVSFFKRLYPHDTSSISSSKFYLTGR